LYGERKLKLKTRGLIWHYISRVTLFFRVHRHTCLWVSFYSFIALSLCCVVSFFVFRSRCWCSGRRRRRRRRRKKKRVNCCMSVYCAETYWGGGIGEIANPLQWPQLRKRRRHHRHRCPPLLVVPPPPTPLPFPAPPPRRKSGLPPPTSLSFVPSIPPPMPLLPRVPSVTSFHFCFSLFTSHRIEYLNCIQKLKYKIRFSYLFARARIILMLLSRCLEIIRFNLYVYIFELV